MEKWKENPTVPFDSAAYVMTLYKKLLGLNVPTLCLMNGSAFAGGLFFALCHDFRIIAPKGKVCFTEILLNIGLGIAYT